VTLFASADSITSAELAPCCTRALRLDPTVRDIVPHFMLMIEISHFMLMIEATARGTPVLAFRCGSVPKVIEDGVTGNVVDSEQEASRRCRQTWLTIATRCGNGLKSDLLPQEWPAIMSALIASC
jgi:Glycosyl transferases group 1